MEVQQDFKELLELFNAHRVEYVIVGGYAPAFHGAPRYTEDVDPYPLKTATSSAMPCRESKSHVFSAKGKEANNAGILQSIYSDEG